MTVIDVVLFGNTIQSIDARIPSFQSFFQSRPGSHVLITGPVKFDPRLVQEALKVETSSALFDPLAASRFSPCHSPRVLWTVCPTLPNLLVTFEGQSSWPWGTSSWLSFWDCNRLRRRRRRRCRYQ